MKWMIITTCLCLALNISAQENKKREVAEAIEKLHKAMVDADSTSLSKMVSPILEYVHSSGAVDYKKQFIEKIVSGKSDFVKIDIAEQFITISKKTAIVRHVLTADTNDSGKPGHIQLSIMQVWQKSGGHWRLLARKATKMT